MKHMHPNDSELVALHSFTTKYLMQLCQRHDNSDPALTQNSNDLHHVFQAFIQ